MEKETTMNKDLALAISYILSKASNEDLHKIYDATAARRDTLAQAAKRAMASGMQVKFSHGGITYAGVIKAIKIKKATVEVTSPKRINYTVPLQMLEAA